MIDHDETNEILLELLKSSFEMGYISRHNDGVVFDAELQPLIKMHWENGVVKTKFEELLSEIRFVPLQK